MDGAVADDMKVCVFFNFPHLTHQVGNLPTTDHSTKMSNKNHDGASILPKVGEGDFVFILVEHSARTEIFYCFCIKLQFTLLVDIAIAVRIKVMKVMN